MTNIIDREGMRRDVLAMEQRANVRLRYKGRVEYTPWQFARILELRDFRDDCRAFAAELEGRIHES